MFEIKRLSIKDINLILDFQERIYMHLDNKTIFQRSTKEFVSYCLGEGGLCYAVFKGEKLVAYRVVYFPKYRSDNMAQDINLPGSEWAHVAHWDTIAVDPQWRGQNISFMMNQVALEELKNYDIRHLFATTSPYNPHALNTLFKIGYRVVDLKVKFGDKLRLICYREFPTVRSIKNDQQMVKEVLLNDVEVLKDILQKGYVGISIKKTKKPCLRLVPLTTNLFDPLNWGEYKALGKRMMDDMVDYLSDIEAKAVWQPVPPEIRRQLHTPLPKNNTSADIVYKEFLETILPYSRGNIHPRFWGWVNGSGIPIAMLADFLASVMNTTVGSGQNSAMMVEEQVIEWMKSAFDWPKNGSGILTSGCSMGQIIALAAARQDKAGWNIRKFGLTAGPRLTIYCSSETHHSVIKAVELLGLGNYSLRQIPVKSDSRIDMDQLRSTLLKDKKNHYRPICIVGNAGTVNTGAVDPLLEISHLCQKEHLWFHIDGAFGGFAWLSKEHRYILEGLNQADSLVFDLHKWMYMPFDISCLLVRKNGLLESTFQTKADYMTKTKEGPAAYSVSFSERGIEQTRRFRALKAWFAIKTHGIDCFRKAIQENINQVQYLAKIIRERENLELCSSGQLNVVCFRFIKPGASDAAINHINQNILSELQKKGLFVPSHTIIDGKFVIRVANTNHRTKKEDFDDLIEKAFAEYRKICRLFGI